MVQYQFGPKLTPMVRKLIIINSVIFFVQMLVSLGLRISQPATIPASQLLQFFALWPNEILKTGFVWQLFTYMFLHGGLFHLLFNMLALWMFGSELEDEWGSAEFLRYYLVSGVGAGIIIFLVPVILGQQTGPTVGASGAILALLLAYAIYWPDRRLLFMFIFPIKVKYFVLGIGLLSMFFTFSSSGMGSVSHAGHLGGLISGYLYLTLAQQQRAYSTWKYSKWNFMQQWRNRRQKKLWEKAHKEKTTSMNTEQKVDALLEKISRYGMKSLSHDEKRFLKRASRSLDEKDKNIH